MTPLNPKIQKALKKTVHLHAKQKRKLDDVPYSSHPISVAWLLSNYTDDEATICAGLLHDVLEDVAGYDFQDMESEFGNEVACLVKDVSEDKDSRMTPQEEHRSWKERKLKYIDHLRSCNEKSLMICAADKIHNLFDLMISYHVMGNLLWKKFNGTKEETVWFYEEVLNILKERCQSNIVEEYEKLMKKVTMTL